MDPIQTGIAELERQRKRAGFNFSVLLSALRESSEHFQQVRENDYERVVLLTRVLNEALAEQAGAERCPAYWSERARAHATSLVIHSKFYAAMMGGIRPEYSLLPGNY